MKELRQMINWKVWFTGPKQQQRKYIIVTTDQDSEDSEGKISELLIRLYPTAQVEEIEMLSTSFFVG